MNTMIIMELRFFLMSVLCGVILLVIYDCLRIFRKVIEHDSVWISIEDILYWVFSAVLIFRMMYEMNNGIIRGFSMAGVLLGMIIYKYSISEYVVKGISFVLIQVKKFIMKLIHLLLKPLGFVKKKVIQLLKAIAKVVRKRITPIKQFVHNKAKGVWIALQNKVKRGRIDESGLDKETE